MLLCYYLFEPNSDVRQQVLMRVDEQMPPTCPSCQPLETA